MTADVFERLKRIFELERKQGWRNRSVVGGIEALRARWTDDARAVGVDAATIGVIDDLMGRYVGAAEAERPAIVETLMAVAADPTSLPKAMPPARPAQSGKQSLPRQGASQLAPQATAAKAAADPDDETDDDLEDANDGLSEIDPADYVAPMPTDVAQRRARIKQDAVERDRQRRPPRGDAPLDAQGLSASVEVLAGVGKSTAVRLAKLGISTVWDLLWHLPARHDDFSQLRTIAQLQPGEQATVVANLWEIQERKLSFNRHMIQGILGDGTGTLRATWWSKYVRAKLKTGRTMRFSGRVGLFMGHKTLDNPLFEAADRKAISTGRIMPVYPLTEGLSNAQLSALVENALGNWGGYVADPLPRPLLQQLGLPELSSALQQVHFPDSQEQLETARRRLAFAELFYIQLGVQRRRHRLQQSVALALPATDDRVAHFQAALPFPLTGAQQRVLAEVTRDMARTVPMSRLIQGDVGSGKTAVAAGAMAIAAHHGAQSALLAPTQILAEQHYRALVALLAPLHRGDGLPLRTALLTGRVTGAEREALLADLQAGAVDVVVGTTALLQEGVQFRRLGFVVVDEQHRFGVEQRGALRSQTLEPAGGETAEPPQPHMLVMSATPIPRSLALTIYGDLDVSVIDEMPPGRSAVKTKWVKPRERERYYAFLRRQVQAGRQGYIIYPLVAESDKLDVGAAVEQHARLSSEIFPELRLGLLHGRLSGAEKDQVMRGFATGAYDILVSTTVVEVGIDVPNATVILIEDAERFGLAQLHQLRGRVGRGEHPGYCALISDARGANAEERLRVLEETTDGFLLAEKDLQLRGPGDFLGTRQSGLPDLRVAQLSDTATLAMAREAAQRLFATDPELQGLPLLAAAVEQFWRGHGDLN